MLYILTTRKTPSEDGEFHSVISALSFRIAKHYANSFNLVAIAATKSEINWLKNDQRVRKSGTPTLPKDFDPSLQQVKFIIP